MERWIRTDPFPQVAAGDIAGARFISLHPAAAAGFGVSNYSLKNLARDVIRSSGFAIAEPLVARDMLKSVISSVLPGNDPSALADRIGRVLEVVLRTGIDTQALIEHGSRPVRELGMVSRGYLDALGAKNYIDAAELFRVAADQSPKKERLFIHGYHRARAEEIAFIDAIAGPGSVYCLPCTEQDEFTVNRRWAEYLAERGWKIDDSRSPPSTAGEKLAARLIGSPAGGAAVEAFAYPNVDAEVRGVLADAKQMVAEGADPSGIAFVCRGMESYSSAIAAVSAEFGLPVRMDHRVKLSGTVFGGFVRLLLDAALLDFGYEATARLLMHPFGPGLNGGGWTKARQDRATGRAAWIGLGAPLNVLDWQERQPLTGWIASIKAVLDAFDVRQKAAGRAREIRAHDRFLKSLAFSAEVSGTREMSLDEFAGVVSEILSDTSVRFSTSAVGIAVLEPDAVIGGSYEHMFVLGMAEGMFPVPAPDDPVVDLFERRQLAEHGVEFASAADLARWESLSFYFTLLAARRSVRLSYPRTDGKDELVPSSFFDRLDIKPSPAPPAGHLVSSIPEWRGVMLRHDAQLAADAALDAARDQLRVESARESSAPYDEFDGVVGYAIDPASRKWSVSQLTTIGQCPFRWFAQRILRLRPVEEIDLGMDYTKRGTFYHRVLEIAVGQSLDAPDIRAATLQSLEAAFEQAEAEADVELPMLSNWDLQRSEHLRALRKAVEAADFIRDGARVVGLEQDFNLEWEGFPMTGKIDRVDNTTDGLIAIDYKTSSAAPKGAKDEQGDLKVDIQIPIYSKVALKNLYPDGEWGSSLYYSLVKGKVLREEKEDDMAKLEVFAARTKAMLAAGSFAVDPDDDEAACTYCDYDMICRKGPRLKRKTNAE